MMDKIIAWLTNRTSADDQAQPVNMRNTGAHTVSRPKKPVRPSPTANVLKMEATESLQIEDAGPSKNRLIRNKYVREDTGTHETLKILDDSIFDSDEESGIDPYNTGGFDRSKNWRNRYSK